MTTKEQHGVSQDAESAWWSRSELFNILDDLRWFRKGLADKTKNAHTMKFWQLGGEADTYANAAMLFVEQCMKCLWQVCKEGGAE